MCLCTTSFLRAGHNLSQLVLGSLMDKGLAWALEEPFSRAAFPLVCLAPFLSKLSPSEAERVAAALSQRLDDLELDQQEEQGGEVSAQQLEAFLSNLKVWVDENLRLVDVLTAALPPALGDI